MTRISFSVLLLLGIGALETLAASPRIQLEMGTDSSGCVDVEGCSYGCGKISSSAAELNVFTPLCSEEAMKPEFPERLTMWGKTETPHLLDQDLGSKYKCSEVEKGSQQFVCRHKNHKNVKSAQPSSSAGFDTPSNVHASVIMGDEFYIRSDFMASAESSASTFSRSASFAPKGFSPASASVDMETSSFELFPVSTSSVYAAAATPDSDVCQYIPEIMGARIGLGNLEDCCIYDDDCHGSCINGACDGENNIPTETWNSEVSLPSPTSCVKYSTIYNKGRGLGNSGDCCMNSDDCRGACIDGICNSENNNPPPVCHNNKYKGKRNGKGPEGVCCKTQADCKESCDRGVCTAPEKRRA
ncbi:unnamed protein product [Mucor hiemalis]